MKKLILKVISVSLVGLSLQAAKADDSVSTKISTGLFYASGQSQTFGSADSTLYSVPLMFSWDTDKVHVNLITSYLDVNNHYPDYGTTVKASGVGDTTLSVGYDLTEAPWLTVKIKHKFATGNSKKGLSTGKDDNSVQLDYFTPVTARASTFATLGYKFVGKVAGVSMQDSGYASLGAGYLFPSRTSIGISADYRQTTYTNLSDQTGVSVFVGQPLNKDWSVSGFGGYDNTKSTSLGLTFTRKF